MTDNQLAELLTLRVYVGHSGERYWTNSDSQLHRVYGPAVIWPNGDCDWYRNGAYHRTDGPALDSPSGDAVMWYLDGQQLTQAQWSQRIGDMENKNAGG